MNHQTSYVSQIAYQSPQVSTQPTTESPLVDLDFVVPVFSLGDDPIACLNKAMDFLTVVASSRFPSTNNQLKTSSNPKNQATIQDGMVTVQKVQRTQDPGVPDGQAVQTIIPNNAAFQTEDLDTYDSDCDDLSNAKAVLMANISNYGSDVISEVPHSETYLNDMENQSVLAMQDFEQPLAMDSTDIEIHSDSNIIPKLDAKVDIGIFFVYAPVKKVFRSYNKGTRKIIETIHVTFDELTAMASKQFSLGLGLQFPVVAAPRAVDLVDSLVSMLIDQDAPSTSITSTQEQEHSPNTGFEESPKTQTLNDDPLNESPHEDLTSQGSSSNVLQLHTLFEHLGRWTKNHPIANVIGDPSQFFENNDLKAQLQDKDSTICKLKDIIKSLREKSKEENVNYDYGEIKTKNVELEYSVAKLSSKNERLCNEINHVKQVFKEQFNSIKRTCVHTKESSDSLIDKLNLKSVENEDLKAQIHDKIFVITSLKTDLRRIKEKEIIDIAAQKPSTNTIVLEMFKLDLKPLAPKLLQNRKAHIHYLKYTQEKADIL
nr:hypothetical protein [Tanacetum cinerariifolium]